jgi:hypothetical protein
VATIAQSDCFIWVYPDESPSSDVETRPIRIDLGPNGTYPRGHMLIGQFW